MKNILKTAVMVLIVSIFGLTKANAQKFDGHGLTTIKTQRETNVTAIENNFYKAIFGTVQEASHIFRSDLQYVSQQQIMDALGKNFTEQMNEDFNPAAPGEYSIQYIVYDTNSPEWKTLCKDNVDGYILDQKGSLSFKYGDPSKSWVSENKSQRVVAIVTHIPTGAKARYFADCINPFPFPSSNSEYGTSNNSSASTQSAGSNTNINNVSIMFNKNPYADADNKAAGKNFHISTGVVVGGLVLTVLVIAADIAIGKAKAAKAAAAAKKPVNQGPSGSYPNNWPGTGGSTSTPSTPPATDPSTGLPFGSY